ncbi:heterokaryon incompatibility protein-domain-containing protein [Xylaria scruposa]|nr:heterokaryon incompatibility protein-domain-containing protein [Xylaria scruposa]
MAGGALVEDRYEIRLIHILKDARHNPDSIIRCTMKTVSLLDMLPSYKAFENDQPQCDRPCDLLAAWIKLVDPSRVSNKYSLLRAPHAAFYRFTWGDFATLSYTWGDPSITERISVDGKEVEVTKNLADSLRVLRWRDWFHPSGYAVWIDAISINQEDVVEQGAQVARMHHIFASSWTTVAYLGNATPNSRDGIQLLKDLAETWVTEVDSPPSMVQELQADPGTLGQGKWLALYEFLQRPYWSRLWVVQEIVLAPDNMLMFAGRDSITWREVQDGLSAIHVHFWYVKDLCFEYDRKLLKSTKGIPEHWNTETLHHIDEDLSLLSLKEELGEEKMCTSELLEVAGATVCSLPIDKLVVEKIVVDYGTDVAQLFELVARLFIHHEGLEVLRSGTMWNDTSTASWAPDWTWNHGRRDMLKPRIPYEADKFTSPTLSFSMDGRLLTTRSVILEEIWTLGGGTGSHDYANIPNKSVESKYKTMADTRHALHRTLIGNRSGKFAMALFQQRALTEPEWGNFTIQGPRYREWTQWREVNDELLLAIPNGSPNSEVRLGDETTFNEFVRFRHTGIGRRFAMTRSGRFAWIPENQQVYQVSTRSDARQVQRGDIFVLVYGCRVPLVARRLGDKLQILGEGYIDGLMDGAVHEDIIKGELVVSDLTFC